MQDNSFTFNSKISLIYSLILLALLVFIFDYGFGGFLRYLYFHQKGGEAYETTYSISDMSQDIVVLGSSRASRHYVPDVITKYTNMSCYNAGRDAMALNYVEAILRAITSRYKPKLLLLDLTPYMININADEDRLLGALLPYYEDHAEIRPIFSKRGKLERVKMLSQIYPFNSTILVSIKHNLVNSHSQSGFVPLFKTITDREIEIVESASNVNRKPVADVPFHQGNIEALYRIIRIAKDHGIPLVIIVSPFFSVESDRIVYIRKYASIAREQGVLFLDFSADPDFLKVRRLFADKDHLNREGAESFSRKLVNVLAEKNIGVF